MNGKTHCRPFLVLQPDMVRIDFAPVTNKVEFVFFFYISSSLRVNLLHISALTCQQKFSSRVDIMPHISIGSYAGSLYIWEYRFDLCLYENSYKFGESIITLPACKVHYFMLLLCVSSYQTLYSRGLSTISLWLTYSVTHSVTHSLIN